MPTPIQLDSKKVNEFIQTLTKIKENFVQYNKSIPSPKHWLSDKLAKIGIIRPSATQVVPPEIPSVSPGVKEDMIKLEEAQQQIKTPLKQAALSPEQKTLKDTLKATERAVIKFGTNFITAVQKIKPKTQTELTSVRESLREFRQSFNEKVTKNLGKLGAKIEAEINKVASSIKNAHTQLQADIADKQGNHYSTNKSTLFGAPDKQTTHKAFREELNDELAGAKEIYAQYKKEISDLEFLVYNFFNIEEGGGGGDTQNRTDIKELLQKYKIIDFVELLYPDPDSGFPAIPFKRISDDQIYRANKNLEATMFSVKGKLEQLEKQYPALAEKSKNQTLDAEGNSSPTPTLSPGGGR